MKKKPLHRISSLLAATVLGLFLLTGCAGKSTEAVQAQEDADTIQVYLWSNSLYEKYAPYVQARLPTLSLSWATTIWTFTNSCRKTAVCRTL